MDIYFKEGQSLNLHWCKTAKKNSSHCLHNLVLQIIEAWQAITVLIGQSNEMRVDFSLKGTLRDYSEMENVVENSH